MTGCGSIVHSLKVFSSKPHALLLQVFFSISPSFPLTCSTNGSFRISQKMEIRISFSKDHGGAFELMPIVWFQKISIPPWRFIFQFDPHPKGVLLPGGFTVLKMERQNKNRNFTITAEILVRSLANFYCQ